ncbi:MAG: HesA/MoeB/ThiF family protein [Thermodesulfobacteriota bacterium]
MDDRYERNGLSEAEQETLQGAAVSIIGCGGLGGRTAELLTRVGIGTIILTDPDTFDESNLNRQLFSTPETLGLEKAAVVAAELQKINPQTTIHFHVQAFNEGSITGAHCVVDCLDSPGDRKQLARLCRKHEIPLIHGAVKNWYGQAGVDHRDSPLIDSLYPHGAKQGVPQVLPMTVALVAAMQGAEVCKCILGKDSPLQKGWLQCDLLHCDYGLISIGKQTKKAD